MSPCDLTGSSPRSPSRHDGFSFFPPPVSSHIPPGVQPPGGHSCTSQEISPLVSSISPTGNGLSSSSVSSSRFPSSPSLFVAPFLTGGLPWPIQQVVAKHASDVETETSDAFSPSFSPIYPNEFPSDSSRHVGGSGRDQLPAADYPPVNGVPTSHGGAPSPPREVSYTTHTGLDLTGRGVSVGREGGVIERALRTDARLADVRRRRGEESSQTRGSSFTSNGHREEETLQSGRNGSRVRSEGGLRHQLYPYVLQGGGGEGIGGTDRRIQQYDGGGVGELRRSGNFSSHYPFFLSTVGTGSAGARASSSSHQVYAHPVTSGPGGSTGAVETSPVLNGGPGHAIPIQNFLISERGVSLPHGGEPSSEELNAVNRIRLSDSTIQNPSLYVQAPTHSSGVGVGGDNVRTSLQLAGSSSSSVFPGSFSSLLPGDGVRTESHEGRRGRSNQEFITPASLGRGFPYIPDTSIRDSHSTTRQEETVHSQALGGSGFPYQNRSYTDILQTTYFPPPPIVPPSSSTGNTGDSLLQQGSSSHVNSVRLFGNDERERTTSSGVLPSCVSSLGPRTSSSSSSSLPPPTQVNGITGDVTASVEGRVASAFVISTHPSQTPVALPSIPSSLQSYGDTIPNASPFFPQGMNPSPNTIPHAPHTNRSTIVTDGDREKATIPSYQHYVPPSYYGYNTSPFVSGRPLGEYRAGYPPFSTSSHPLTTPSFPLQDQSQSSSSFSSHPPPLPGAIPSGATNGSSQRSSGATPVPYVHPQLLPEGPDGGGGLSNVYLQNVEPLSHMSQPPPPPRLPPSDPQQAGITSSANDHMTTPPIHRDSRRSFSSQAVLLHESHRTSSSSSSGQAARDHHQPLVQTSSVSSPQRHENLPSSLPHHPVSSHLHGPGTANPPPLSMSPAPDERHRAFPSTHRVSFLPSSTSGLMPPPLHSSVNGGFVPSSLPTGTNPTAPGDGNNGQHETTKGGGGAGHAASSGGDLSVTCFPNDVRNESLAFLNYQDCTGPNHHVPSACGGGMIMAEERGMIRGLRGLNRGQQHGQQNRSPPRQYPSHPGGVPIEGTMTASSSSISGGIRPSIPLSSQGGADPPTPFSSSYRDCQRSTPSVPPSSSLYPGPRTLIQEVPLLTVNPAFSSGSTRGERGAASYVGEDLYHRRGSVMLRSSSAGSAEARRAISSFSGEGGPRGSINTQNRRTTTAIPGEYPATSGSCEGGSHVEENAVSVPHPPRPKSADPCVTFPSDGSSSSSSRFSAMRDEREERGDRGQGGMSRRLPEDATTLRPTTTGDTSIQPHLQGNTFIPGGQGVISCVSSGTTFVSPLSLQHAPQFEPRADAGRPLRRGTDEARGSLSLQQGGDISKSQAAFACVSPHGSGQEYGMPVSQEERPPSFYGAPLQVQDNERSIGQSSRGMEVSGGSTEDRYIVESQRCLNRLLSLLPDAHRSAGRTSSNTRTPPLAVVGEGDRRLSQRRSTSIGRTEASLLDPRTVLPSVTNSVGKQGSGVVRRTAGGDTTTPSKTEEEKQIGSQEGGRSGSEFEKNVEERPSPIVSGRTGVYLHSRPEGEVPLHADSSIVIPPPSGDEVRPSSGAHSSQLIPSSLQAASPDRQASYRPHSAPGLVESTPNFGGSDQQTGSFSPPLHIPTRPLVSHHFPTGSSSSSLGLRQDSYPSPDDHHPHPSQEGLGVGDTTRPHIPSPYDSSREGGGLQGEDRQRSYAEIRQENSLPPSQQPSALPPALFGVLPPPSGRGSPLREERGSRGQLRGPLQAPRSLSSPSQDASFRPENLPSIHSRDIRSSEIPYIMHQPKAIEGGASHEETCTIRTPSSLPPVVGGSSPSHACSAQRQEEGQERSRVRREEVRRPSPPLDTHRSHSASHVEDEEHHLRRCLGVQLEHIERQRRLVDTLRAHVASRGGIRNEVSPSSLPPPRRVVGEGIPSHPNRGGENTVNEDHRLAPAHAPFTHSPNTIEALRGQQPQLQQEENSNRSMVSSQILLGPSSSSFLDAAARVGRPTTANQLRPTSFSLSPARYPPLSDNPEICPMLRSPTGAVSHLNDRTGPRPTSIPLGTAPVSSSSLLGDISSSYIRPGQQPGEGLLGENTGGIISYEGANAYQGMLPFSGTLQQISRNNLYYHHSRGGRTSYTHPNVDMLNRNLLPMNAGNVVRTSTSTIIPPQEMGRSTRPEEEGSSYRPSMALSGDLRQQEISPGRGVEAIRTGHLMGDRGRGSAEAQSDALRGLENQTLVPSSCSSSLQRGFIPPTWIGGSPSRGQHLTESGRDAHPILPRPGDRSRESHTITGGGPGIAFSGDATAPPPPTAAGNVRGNLTQEMPLSSGDSANSGGPYHRRSLTGGDALRFSSSPGPPAGNPSPALISRGESCSSSSSSSTQQHPQQPPLLPSRGGSGRTAGRSENDNRVAEACEDEHENEEEVEDQEEEEEEEDEEDDADEEEVEGDDDGQNTLGRLGSTGAGAAVASAPSWCLTWNGDGAQEVVELYEVERIVGVRRLVDGSKRFKVRWKDYVPADDTWEPHEHLEGLEELLEEAETVLGIETFHAWGHVTRAMTPGKEDHGDPKPKEGSGEEEKEGEEEQQEEEEHEGICERGPVENEEEDEEEMNVRRGRRHPRENHRESYGHLDGDEKTDDIRLPSSSSSFSSSSSSSSSSLPGYSTSNEGASVDLLSCTPPALSSDDEGDDEDEEEEEEDGQGEEQGPNNDGGGDEETAFSSFSFGQPSFTPNSLLPHSLPGRGDGHSVSQPLHASSSCSSSSSLFWSSSSSQGPSHSTPSQGQQHQNEQENGASSPSPNTVVMTVSPPPRVVQMVVQYRSCYGQGFFRLLWRGSSSDAVEWTPEWILRQLPPESISSEVRLQMVRVKERWRARQAERNGRAMISSWIGCV
ncbi:chromo (chrromatin organization modifier) domain-containing protein [Cystoisospora suis]|uniref:Chromo (Chrromatin organization modifier) domain-containing protein n=1 Tax=Cystoisospora suis TaxID=483139 RepID=A0A2C6L4Z4_9APIC|nr:chromo (chrromatin organization modifier) domain-containing protein [Cystoisospora suis]